MNISRKYYNHLRKENSLLKAHVDDLIIASSKAINLEVIYDTFSDSLIGYKQVDEVQFKKLKDFQQLKII